MQEQAVLGSVLQDGNLFRILVDRLVTLDYFTETRTRETYQAMEDLFANDKPIDLLSVSEQLQKMKAQTGMVELGEMVDCTPSVGHINYYLESLIKEYRSRKLAEIAGRITAEIAGKADPESIFTEIEGELCSAFADTDRPDLGQVCDEVIADYDLARKQGGLGWPSFCEAYNNILGTHVRGMLEVTAAEPGYGKTMKEINTIAHLCKLGVPCAFVPLDAGTKSFVQTMLAYKAGVNSFRFRLGTATDEEMETLKGARESVAGMQVYVYDGPPEFGRIKAWLIDRVKRDQVGYAAVDYVQLVGMRNSKYSKTEEQSEVAYGFRDLARSMKICLSVLSQLNKSDSDNSTVAPPAPSIRRLRGSGEIVAAADVVTTIYRKPGAELSEFTLDKDWDMEWATLKNRYGPIASVYMTMCRKQQKWMSTKEYRDRQALINAPWEDGE